MAFSFFSRCRVALTTTTQSGEQERVLTKCQGRRSEMYCVEEEEAGEREREVEIEVLILLRLTHIASEPT